VKLSQATATTRLIRVSVHSFYREDVSDAAEQAFIFAYRIILENLGNTPVQLISRFWEISDSLSENKQVQGEGVVGEQPVIIPGESYQYVSWSPLTSEIGKMKGLYLFKDLSNDEMFEVEIPEFILQTPARLN
jgi:ApaG protein